MAKVDDIGLNVVQSVFKLLEIDDEWSNWDSRGFEWWGYNLRQRVWATSGFDDDGIFIHRVYAVSDAICNIQKSQAEVDGILGAFGMMATGAAWVFDPSTKTIKLRTAMMVHKDTADWVGRTLGAFTILQATEALERAEYTAELVGGEVDASAHPVSGERTNVDGMLAVIDDVFRPKGQMPSPWQGNEELNDIREMLNQGNCLSMGDENGLSAEFSFGDETSLLKVLTEESNPWIGSGVGLFLQLPVWATQEETSNIAGAFNRAEANDKCLSHLTGSWCSKKMGENFMVAFATFIPALLHQPILLTNFVYSAAGRARWAEGLIKPEEKPSDVAKLVAERFGYLASPDTD
jgi:hypothetical protein